MDDKTLIQFDNVTFSYPHDEEDSYAPESPVLIDFSLKIPKGQFIANFVYEKGTEPGMIRTHKVGDERCGTGDLFAAIVAADAVNGVPFRESVRKASVFVRKSMVKSIERGIDRKNGVCFEEILHTLKV